MSEVKQRGKVMRVGGNRCLPSGLQLNLCSQCFIWLSGDMISYLDDVGSLNCALHDFDCLSHIPDGKGSSDKKFISNHQTFSTEGCGQLDMRLGLFAISNTV